MENAPNSNPYSILKVEPNCNIETAKRQFKKLAIIYHPDKLNYHRNKERKGVEANEKNRTDETSALGIVPIREQNQGDKEEDKNNAKKDNVDFVTLVWAYEQILKDIQHGSKSEKYENALNIKKVDLQYISEENAYIYFCRCGDFFLFAENLYCEYYVIYACQSCSCSVYLTP
ncbi:DnaJ protein, putative [Plasmodium knowlesi strain H]|uniref:DnaJ protein, putative n=3 Tax=Plasmodium knowlesi TaxID=5850 RepID=A0A5K1UTL3_PLAKH|nr:DnaJ protein, putative [Plasmodium knowlesi strain H]OTN67017.1 putative DnaJ protein [Plasmodium knowlesi]CAA9988815.1 DnaJ protein, putative [Plasmodium knowlesi strain H]SBO21815.1 DnaJ protein, putative [Plasmodium knowlesi strain H]SBO22188.1 DnaJ protein, putative [Plasmodium knowlesi strain H]VVS78289.1 DnaJ protein, putative [Plasmodium knowlesi strain H]|eukprot:XP_002259794.1 hypothetical protein, conserved in Plasmodium species [Plasmodium knowlesi strain H]